MFEKIASFVLVLIAGILVSLPIDFNKYDLPPTLSFYIRSLAPCKNPIYYKIGTVDPKFNLSNQDVIKDAQLGADLWNQAAGKNLLVYDPKGPLTINFIYDERQSISAQISATETQLKIAKAQLTPDETKYNALVSDFKTRVDALNASISYWNSHGGAPPDEYQKLINEQNSLKQEADQINVLVAKLNMSAQNYNNIVYQLNQASTSFNTVIQGKPEEGLYSASTNEIEIYLVASKNELVHTLAHEFGHALGLPHNTDKNAIMYALTNTTIKTTQADLNSLDTLCPSLKK